MSRERRKSERRLSKGAQMQWSSCQMIDSSELKLVSSIGSGAYGKVGGCACTPHASSFLQRVVIELHHLRRHCPHLMERVITVGMTPL